ncbi:glutamate racemase [Candidatus Dojkabacteria bacterium]|uniref:Glutamate racemase n=1 Tax=Candidatus Dojkabacteria bacterium TaxID=2099670 RepID=A0A3M0Z1C8_9BACT|nr:MAG: glutamate racemase [Candidatus Dojkabacteria bacterium]
MKIGLFDSGIGGLTVLRAIREKFPNVDLVYLGDTARVPYGNKSPQTVVRYSFECADFLLFQDINLLVVACNTASSYALEELKKALSIPVVGVIEPGVKSALRTTSRGRVGVIGTMATIKSGSHKKLLEEYGVIVFQKACPLFVPLVEEGIIEGEIAKKVVEYYLQELKEVDIDTLILGCTHYPLLKPLIEDFIGEKVKVVDSAESTAREIEPLVSDQGSSELELYFTDHSQNMNFLIEFILGKPTEHKLVAPICNLR